MHLATTVDRILGTPRFPRDRLGGGLPLFTEIDRRLI
jgi:hypothetical protein